MERWDAKTQYDFVAMKNTKVEPLRVAVLREWSIRLRSGFVPQKQKYHLQPCS